MFRKKVYFFILIIVMSLTPRLSASNFADTYGFSAYGISMGNAMTAIVNDWSSVWYNIAGLGKTTHMLEEKKYLAEKNIVKARPATEMMASQNSTNGLHPNEFFVSYFYSYSMHSLNGVSPDKKKEALDQLDIGVIILGMALDVKKMIKMPKAISSCRFGVGMGMMHDGSLVNVNDINPATPNFTRYGREAEKALILGGLGMGFLNDMFGFGIGVNLLFKGEGKVNLSEVLVQSEVQEPKSEIKLSFSLSPVAIAGIYFSPGKLTKVLKGLHFGASYRMESELKVSPFDAANELLVGGITMQLEMQMIDYYTPHIVTTGIAYTILGMVTLSLDFEYQFWSLYKFHGQHPIGDSKKILDVWVPRFGMNFALLNFLGISTGYYYQPSMVSDNMASGILNILDNDKHVISLGLNFTVPQLKLTGGPLIINLAYQMQYFDERKVTKGSAHDPVLNPHYKYGGTVHTIMLSLGMKI